MEYPIRIAHVIGKWVGGGVEAVVMNYYRNIDRTKIQFDFICDNDSTNIPYEEIKSLGGRVFLIPPYQKIFAYQKELRKLLKENNYQIIHSHINTLSIFPLYAAKKAGVPIRIAHSHSTTNKKEWKKNIIKQVLRPFSKIYATNYFACTEHAANWLFDKKEQVYILNNAIDLDMYKYDKKIRKEVRKELNIEEGTLVIGHIGRFVAQKNHDFLIDIFDEFQKRNSNSILLLVGQGPLKEEIENKVKKLNIESKVVFLGQRTDANRLYQAFDVFLLPSIYEGLGMVLIEAQTSGLPCIASTEVPAIAKVTNYLEFVDLNDKTTWLNKLKTTNINNRKDNTIEVKQNRYDIKEESKKLENEYINMLKKD